MVTEKFLTETDVEKHLRPDSEAPSIRPIPRYKVTTEEQGPLLTFTSHKAKATHSATKILHSVPRWKTRETQHTASPFTPL